jgi:NitT/TauT family transport system ATP-binding protein
MTPAPLAGVDYIGRGVRSLEKVQHLNKLVVQNVSFAYSGGRESVPVLNGMELSVRAGEFVSVVGPSGCGKSTLLSLLAGLTRPTGGTILLDGREVTGPGVERGIVFQHYSLFPWMTARSNITFGVRRVRPGTGSRELRALADRYLELVGLGGLGNKFPSQLSGGMQQRVAIARAFAMAPDILLMDEPFSAVDTKNRLTLQELLLHLWDEGEKRKTVVFITHDIDEAILLADRIVVMSARDGSVLKEFPIPFERPRRRGAIMKGDVYARLRNSVIDLFHEDEELLLSDGGTPEERTINR